MKIHRLNIILMVIFSLACFAGEKEGSATEREILFQLSDSLTQEVISVGSIGAATSLQLKLAEHPETIIFRSAILQALFAKKILVFEKQSTTDTTLELTIRASSVFYGAIFSESLFGARKVERIATVKCNAVISSSSTGKIIWAGLVTKSTIDTVGYSSVDQLHSDSFPLTSYTKPALSFFDSLLEPAIVTIASGVAIYLFFTIRS
ncbi:MAG: hypothetical protein PHP42_00335 [Bacteroidota bacterium]|nr:hypothetical protein [Bacteroidota bacterium]